MDLGMRDEQVKAQLFRFVDVLPVLNADAQVNEHLREYLSSVSRRLPLLSGRAVRFIPRHGWVGHFLADLTRHNATRMARRFIAATDLPEAADAIGRLRQRKLGFTIDLLGEAVLSEIEADKYQAQYLNLVEGLAERSAAWAPEPLIDQGDDRPLPRVNVSVKLSSLYSQFDPIDPSGTSRATLARLRPILRLARQLGVFVNIDMEQYAFKDLTLALFQQVFLEDEFRDWPDVGIAIQAYLRDTGDDLAMLRDWAEKRQTPIWVRLVKGAYWDYESVIAAQNDWPLPVWELKPRTDANYEAQTEFLMKHRALLRPAIASHNIRSIATALALAERYGAPARSFEFQMLFGMADPVKAALASMGHRVRVYTPFGQLLPGMAYLVRRLLENTSNESFLRAGFVEHLPEEQLLMNPLEILRHRKPAAPARNGSAAEPAPFRNEPLADFSRADSRQLMADALSAVRPQLGRDYPAIINGQPQAGGQWIESVNPSHRRELVGRAERSTPQQALAAIEAAKEAFPAWRDTPAEIRADVVGRCAQIMRRRRWELAAWEVYETGKPWREADADVAEAIDYCEYYARQMLRLSRPQRRDLPGEENEYFYEPRGVVATIAPWNFPLAILCGMTTAALVAGNTVVMKPAEQSPIIAAMLMQAYAEAGAPAGVVNYLPGVGEEIGPGLVEHPDVAMIAFTGSRTVGLSIQRQAALMAPGQQHVKRVVVEMGGKNAVIVDDDADLDQAVLGVVASAFGYAGQKCSACSRVVVLDAIYDALVARLIEATRSLIIGPAEAPGTFVGPVIDAEAQSRILQTIREAKDSGLTAVYEAELGPIQEEGFYVPPTIFAPVPPEAKIAQEEIFGPVLSVIRARDLDEALAIANGTPYALTGGIFSRSPAHLERARREFRVGNLYINRKITGALVDRQPFGGLKLSGIGSKAGGPDYLPQFMQPRTITENTLRHGFAPQAEPAGE